MIKSYEELTEIAQEGYEKLFRASYIINADVAKLVLDALKVSKLEDERVDPKTSMLVNLINLSGPDEVEKYATIYPDHVLAVLIHGISPDGRKRLAFIAKAQGIKRNFDPMVISDQREKLSMSAEKLAGMMGIPIETIEAWETGRKIPDVLELAALADHFEISINSFFILKKSNTLLKHIDSNYDEEEPNLNKKQKEVFLTLESIYNNADKDPSKKELLDMIYHGSFPGYENMTEGNFYRYLGMFKKEGLIVHKQGLKNPIQFTQRGRAVRVD